MAVEGEDVVVGFGETIEALYYEIRDGAQLFALSAEDTKMVYGFAYAMASLALDQNQVMPDDAAKVRKLLLHLLSEQEVQVSGDSEDVILLGGAVADAESTIVARAHLLSSGMGVDGAAAVLFSYFKGRFGQFRTFGGGKLEDAVVVRTFRDLALDRMRTFEGILSGEKRFSWRPHTVEVLTTI